MNPFELGVPGMLYRGPFQFVEQTLMSVAFGAAAPPRQGSSRQCSCSRASPVFSIWTLRAVVIIIHGRLCRPKRGRAGDAVINQAAREAA